MSRALFMILMVVLLTVLEACNAGEGIISTGSAGVPEGMVLIPAGEFMMGSASGEGQKRMRYGEGEKRMRPQHEVYLDAFYMDKYEVTNEQFKRFCDATGYVTEAEEEGWS